MHIDFHCTESALVFGMVIHLLAHCRNLFFKDPEKRPYLESKRTRIVIFGIGTGTGKIQKAAFIKYITGGTCLEPFRIIHLSPEVV